MNFKNLTLLVLLVLIVFSKEILVFNEEVLVLFSFGIFSFLTYNFAGTMISSELDSRALKIKEEFVYYKDMQEKTLSHLISYHNKQKLLCDEVKSIFSTLKKDIDLILFNNSKLFLKSFTSIIEDKLKKIIANELKFNVLLQSKINNELYVYLLSKYSAGKDKKNSTLFLTNSISSLSNIK